MIVPDFDSGNCSTWVVQYPDNGPNACPILKKQTKNCGGEPICAECEVKRNATNDDCCGQMYECGRCLIYLFQIYQQTTS